MRRTVSKLENPLSSMHAAQSPHESWVKKKQTHPGEAIAERRSLSNGPNTGDCNGTKPVLLILGPARSGQVIITHAYISIESL